MNENEFLDQVKKTLDQHAEALDGETLSRLNRARQSALEQAGRKRSKAFKLTWLPVGGAMAAILLTSIFMFRAEEMAIVTNNGVDEIEIIATTDNLELYEQLDFYLWLLEEETGAV